MQRLPTRLAGLVLLQPAVHGDERGFFAETWRSDVELDQPDVAVVLVPLAALFAGQASGILAGSHTDMVGAAVALEKTVDTQTYDVYRVRIVVYMRPQDVAVSKEEADPMVALRETLDTLESQIRTAREKLAQKDFVRPAIEGVATPTA